jgi:hypothetical protein
MRARRRDSRNAIREGGRTGVARFSAGLRILAHTHTRARARVAHVVASWRRPKGERRDDRDAKCLNQTFLSPADEESV